MLWVTGLCPRFETKGFSSFNDVSLSKVSSQNEEAQHWELACTGTIWKKSEKRPRQDAFIFCTLKAWKQMGLCFFFFKDMPRDLIVLFLPYRWNMIGVQYGGWETASKRHGPTIDDLIPTPFYTTPNDVCLPWMYHGYLNLPIFEAVAINSVSPATSWQSYHDQVEDQQDTPVMACAKMTSQRKDLPTILHCIDNNKTKMLCHFQLWEICSRFLFFQATRGKWRQCRMAPDRLQPFFAYAKLTSHGKSQGGSCVVYPTILIKFSCKNNDQFINIHLSLENNTAYLCCCFHGFLSAPESQKMLQIFSPCWFQLVEPNI